MGLFDAMKEKAAELLSGASDKVSELTGTDVGETHQNVTDGAQNLGETAQGYGDAATENVQQYTEGAQGHVDSVTEQAQNVTDPKNYL
jgi:hypothetical protein